MCLCMNTQALPKHGGIFFRITSVYVCVAVCFCCALMRRRQLFNIQQRPDRPVHARPSPNMFLAITSILLSSPITPSRNPFPTCLCVSHPHTHKPKSHQLFLKHQETRMHPLCIISGTCDVLADQNFSMQFTFAVHILKRNRLDDSQLCNYMLQ